MLALVATAAALGAFIPVATSFATEVGNGTFAWNRLGQYALSALAAIAAVGASLWLMGVSHFLHPAVEVGPFALIAFAAFAGLAAGAVAVDRG